jgi:endo-1,4-beta-xylanase
VALAAVTVVAGAVVAVSTTGASAATVDSNAWYEVVNRNSGKALDVCGVSTQNGACVQQYSRSGGQNQQWQFVDSGGGFYRVRARHSSQMLDIYNWSTADNGAIVQWPDHGGNNQQFRLADSPDGYVRLISRHSNKAVQVQNSSTADGARVVQFTDNGSNSQQWQLIRVGGPTPTTTTTSRPPTTTPPNNCSLPSSYRWTSTGSLANPRSGWVSLKRDAPLCYPRRFDGPRSPSQPHLSGV